MKKNPIPENEIKRLKALKEYSIMDSLPEKEYDSITQLASYICETPIALVSLLDEERQWFKSSVGFGLSEAPRNVSFCQYAIMGDEVYEVNNAMENETFANNPLVTGNPNIRFYAGAPLKDENGFNLGSLCVIDTEPRILTNKQKDALKLLANQVVLLLDLRKKNSNFIKSQREFQNFIELSKDLVCIANVDGYFYKVNPAFTDVLGYSKVELEGKLFKDFIHPEDLDKTFKEVEKLSNGHETISFENRYRCKNGKYVLLSWNTAPDPDSRNLYCIARDITKEKEAELNLINSNKLLDESQSIAKIGSWKFDLVTKDLIWSKGHYEIFDLEELASDQLFKAYRSKIHPSDLSGLDKALEKTLTTGADLHYNHRLLFSNGTLKYVVAVGKPYKNEKGEVLGIQGTIQDITDKTLAEQKIEEKAKEINDIKSALDEAAIVAITDQKGVFSYVNENFCAVSKYSKEELIGQDQQIISTGYHSIEFRREVYGTIANGNIWKGEVMNRAKDDSFYWENTTIVPFLNEKGKPYQYIAISTNITQEKLAKENLNSALVDLGKKNKELDQYAYIVSHDLKAPLRAINNLSEWIVEDMPEMPDDVSANFKLLRGRIQRMENLINGVLEYSRIGRTKIEKETTDLKNMLNQIIDSVVPIEGFEVSIMDSIPVIETEKILLQQVFSNLISNSVKYNDKPIGKIECLYEILPDFHQFTIKDNGPGIAKEYHKKVFEVFQTIEARDKKESTGIGLSIVKKIIEEKGGAIYIESENDNGTSFIFTLPK
ncbi:PAS domain S-box protein [Flavobacterium sp. LB3P122]|uniref:PAS domain S-box protein n=1 Tax=Flavobacterium algoriphilum TaxID=3398738 RepID=UPI003A866C44